VIRLRGVVKRYGKFLAVRGIDLDIPRGELFGFLGPNGAGKTTTLRMIAGVLPPTSGRIEIGGVDILTRPMPAKAKMGFIPDRPFVYDKLTGVEFLRFTAALYGQDGRAIETRIDELLELFDLTPWKHELTESYSHGMRQKLIIASALVHRPEAIVVDEPMVGLDPKSARLLKTIFRRFVEKGGTVLMSTHTLEIVEGFCDRVGIIHQGELVACGTIDDLRRSAPSAGAGLEALFLRLTGEHVDHDVDAILD
jgi:ABC-2 type transport system ATP-binding protein